MKARPSGKRAPSKKSSTSARASKSTASKSSAPKTRYPDIRRALERQRANLLGEVGEVLTQHQDQEALPDVSDQASAEVNQHFSMRIREREQKLLKKIDEALDRMKVGIYGICERCGEPINPARLEAVPEATLCVRCKAIVERQARLSTASASQLLIKRCIPIGSTGQPRVNSSSCLSLVSSSRSCRC